MPDADRYLRWLDHGAALALHSKGEGATHRDVIWKLFEEAIETIEKMPDQEKRWLSSGTRSGGWGQVWSDKHEVSALERHRVLSGMAIADGPAKVVPQGSTIDRALDVMDWTNWARQKAIGTRLVRAAMVLASRGDVDAVQKIFSPKAKKADRRITYTIRSMLTAMVIEGLEKNAGLVTAGQVEFRKLA